MSNVELVSSEWFSVLCRRSLAARRVNKVSKLFVRIQRVKFTRDTLATVSIKAPFNLKKIDFFFITFRYFKLSAILSTLLLLSSLVITIYVSLHFKYIHKVSEPFESFDILYDKPWQRYGPYAMGNYDLSYKNFLEIVNFFCALNRNALRLYITSHQSATKSSASRKFAFMGRFIVNNVHHYFRCFGW